MINGQAAKDRLVEFLKAGQAKAEAVLAQVERQVPEDRVVPAARLDFSADHEAGLVTTYEHPVHGLASYGLHRNALRQVAERVGVPTAYAEDLNGSDWGRGLLAKNFRENLRNRVGDEPRFLLRAIDGQVRGFMSSKYRRLDSRPILDAVLGVANKAGAMVASGFAGDVNVSLRVVLPEVRETIPGSGDYVVIGLDFSNSDFGRGALDLSSFALRLACLNGAMVASDYRKIHLGARLSDEVEYSERTLRLDTAATVSAVEDTARGLLSTGRVDSIAEAIAKAASTEIDPKAALASIRKRITKAESEALVAKFNSPDIVDLPAGSTSWRFSNAVSWLAHEADGERALELEAIAGEFIALPKAA